MWKKSALSKEWKIDQECQDDLIKIKYVSLTLNVWLSFKFHSQDWISYFCLWNSNYQLWIGKLEVRISGLILTPNRKFRLKQPKINKSVPQCLEMSIHFWNIIFPGVFHWITIFACCTFQKSVIISQMFHRKIANNYEMFLYKTNLSLAWYKLSHNVYLCFFGLLNCKYQKILMLVPGKLALPHEEKISDTWYTIAINVHLNPNPSKNIVKVQRRDLWRCYIWCCYSFAGCRLYN